MCRYRRCRLVCERRAQPVKGIVEGESLENALASGGPMAAAWSGASRSMKERGHRCRHTFNVVFVDEQPGDAIDDGGCQRKASPAHFRVALRSQVHDDTGNYRKTLSNW